MNATETSPHRIHSCACGHAWADPVTAAETPNLSGEPTPYCPECGARASESSPVVPGTMPRWTDGTGYKRHPAKIKQAMGMAGKAAALRHYQRALSGVRGGDESRTMHALLLGLGRAFASQSPKVALEYWRIGERHGWQFDRANVATIGRECAALAVRVTQYEGDRAGDLLSWDDCRRDPDEEATRLAAQRADAEARAARKAEGNARRAALVELRDRIAPGCAGVVVAELVEDQSDPMSDYHGHKTVRTVVVGFCKSTRDRFDWMRNAARNSADPRIAAMADLPAEHEHRNKWSMGAGYFIAEPNARGYSSDDNSGWKLRIRAVEGDHYDAPEIDPGLLDPGKRAGAPADVPTGKEDYTDAAGYMTPMESWPECQQAPAGAYTIEEHRHTKKDREMVMVCPAGKDLSRDDFRAWTDDAKATGGWYSRKWGTTPGGWAWWADDSGRAKAQAFAATHYGAGGPGPDGPDRGKRRSWPLCDLYAAKARAMGGARVEACENSTTSPHTNKYGLELFSATGERLPAFLEISNAPETIGALAADVNDLLQQPAPDASTQTADLTTRAARTHAAAKIERIRAMADKLDEQADAKLAPRQENTPKRQAQAASARIDGTCMQRAAGYLRAWADAAEAGDLPALLHKAPTKGEALDAAAKPQEHQANGYHPIPWETSDPAAWHYDEPRHVALRALVEGDPEAEARREREAAKARALAELRNCDIPGFFPTPDPVADRMAELAELQPGDVVGDTGAGIGSLLLAALRAQPDLAGAAGYEVNPTLAKYLNEHVDAGGSPWVTCAHYDFLQMMENKAQHDGPSGYVPDVVLINPPYERLAYLDHVRKAYDWCKRRLVALVPAQVASWSEDFANGRPPSRRACQDFVEWLDGVPHWFEDVDPRAFQKADAFRQAGVATVILVINKD